MILIFFK